MERNWEERGLCFHKERWTEPRQTWLNDWLSTICSKLYTALSQSAVIEELIGDRGTSVVSLVSDVSEQFLVSSNCKMADSENCLCLFICAHLLLYYTANALYSDRVNVDVAWRDIGREFKGEDETLINEPSSVSFLFFCSWRFSKCINIAASASLELV